VLLVLQLGSMTAVLLLWFRCLRAATDSGLDAQRSGETQKRLTHTLVAIPLEPTTCPDGIDPVTFAVPEADDQNSSEGAHAASTAPAHGPEAKLAVETEPLMAGLNALVVLALHCSALALLARSNLLPAAYIGLVQGLSVLAAPMSLPSLYDGVAPACSVSWNVYGKLAMVIVSLLAALMTAWAASQRSILKAVGADSTVMLSQAGSDSSTVRLSPHGSRRRAAAPLSLLFVYAVCLPALLGLAASLLSCTPPVEGVPRLAADTRWVCSGGARAVAVTAAVILALGLAGPVASRLFALDSRHRSVKTVCSCAACIPRSCSPTRVSTALGGHFSWLLTSVFGLRSGAQASRLQNLWPSLLLCGRPALLALLSIQWTGERLASALALQAGVRALLALLLLLLELVCVAVVRPYQRGSASRLHTISLTALALTALFQLLYTTTQIHVALAIDAAASSTAGAAARAAAASSLEMDPVIPAACLVLTQLACFAAILWAPARRLVCSRLSGWDLCVRLRARVC
jgi:hypothetical protein